MLLLDKVSKEFNNQKVLDKLTLKLSDDGITCLLGASGCGKSTTLRIASGLLAPDSGSVCISKGSAGVVFQDCRLLPWLTAEENLALALPAQKRKEQQKKIYQAIINVSLNPQKILKLFPAELSGGMAQRVSIARALLKNSNCLMLDEPFAAVDALTRADLQVMLKNLLEKKQMNALFVTHDLEEAFNIASRILFMANGKITASFESEDFKSLEKQEAVRQKIMQFLAKRN